MKRQIAGQAKLRGWLRILLGCTSLAYFFVTWVSHRAEEAIRSYYFKDFSKYAPNGFEVAGMLVALYLLLVAFAARWRVFAPKPPRG